MARSWHDADISDIAFGVAIGGKADKMSKPENIACGPKADIGRPFMAVQIADSGHYQRTRLSRYDAVS